MSDISRRLLLRVGLVFALVLVLAQSALAAPQEYTSPAASQEAPGGLAVRMEVYASNVYGISGQAHFVIKAEAVLYGSIPVASTTSSLEGFLPDHNNTSATVGSDAKLVFRGMLSLSEFSAANSKYIAITGHPYAIGDSNLAMKQFVIAANAAGAQIESVQSLAARAGLGAAGHWNIMPSNTGIAAIDAPLNATRAVILGIANAGIVVIQKIGTTLSSAWNWFKNLFDGSKASSTVSGGKAVASTSSAAQQYLTELGSAAGNGSYAGQALGGSYGFGSTSPAMVTTSYQTTVASQINSQMCGTAAEAASMGSYEALMYLQSYCTYQASNVAASMGPYASLAYQCQMAAQTYGLGYVLSMSWECRQLYYSNGGCDYCY